MGIKFYRQERIEVTNNWAVPYSPYLLLKYQSHINVEYCCSFEGIKYLFKYQMKGEDMITIGGHTDEITHYLTKRWSGATYAHW